MQFYTFCAQPFKCLTKTSLKWVPKIFWIVRRLEKSCTIDCYVVFVSLQGISDHKLKAFNIGAMNSKKGMSKREQEELKKKVSISQPSYFFIFLPGFVQVLEIMESVGISGNHFPGLESPGIWMQVLKALEIWTWLHHFDKMNTLKILTR